MYGNRVSCSGFGSRLEEEPRLADKTRDTGADAIPEEFRHSQGEDAVAEAYPPCLLEHL